MIEAIELSRHYGRHKAVDNISFSVGRNEIIGFLGPNGAGKSTTMNMITGYLAPTSGTVKINGLDILEEPLEARKLLGYLPEIPPLYPEMTVLDYLKFSGELKRTDRKTVKNSLEKIMDLVKIGDVRGRRIGNLSKGYKQRVGLAQALIGNPSVIVLDEPTVGLDPQQIIEMRNLIRELSGDHTIILSSHILPEVSQICNRLLIMNKGKIVASDTPQELAGKLEGTSQLHLKVWGEEKEIRNAAESLKDLIGVECSVSRDDPAICDLYLKAESHKDIRVEVFFAMSERKLPILLMRPLDISLEDIFLNLTTTEEEN